MRNHGLDPRGVGGLIALLVTPKVPGDTLGNDRGDVHLGPLDDVELGLQVLQI